MVPTLRVVIWTALRTALGTNDWQNRSVMVLLRGVHYGRYRGRGSEVTVDETTESVVTNHKKKLIDPLKKAGANVTIAAVTYRSERVTEWLRNSRVDVYRLLEWKVNGKERTPNDLLLAAYDFILGYSFDTLISIRCDIIFSKPILNMTAKLPLNDSLGVPWKEANGMMPKKCFYRAAETCDTKWGQKGSRYADAILVAPGHAVPDLAFALREATRYDVKWDQHTYLQHLIKHRGYHRESNITTFIHGYWNSNPNVHSNPLFKLARKKHMTSSSSSRRRGHHRREHPHHRRR